MAEIKKITIQKSDEPTLVAEKVIDASSDTVVLVIPKFSKFGESINNFRLIKREAEVLGKTVVIESVDDDVVALAKKSGLEASNPFFSRASSRSSQKKVSDIVIKKKPTSTPARSSRSRVADAVRPDEVVRIKSSSSLPARGASLSSDAFPQPITEMPNEESEPIKTTPLEPVPETDIVSEVIPSKITEVIPLQSRRRGPRPPLLSKRNVIIAGGVILLFGIVPYLALGVLPRADIEITRVRENWNYKGTISVDKNIVAMEEVSGRIPGQVFAEQGNSDLKFEARGEKEIAKKATGKIIIYNAFNAQSQTLVASTRFQAPDGKIFRVTASVTVPGAKLEAGKVIPSSVVADIIADKAGESYNVGPIPKLTIPGFSGTPRFNGFYGEIKEPLKGGFVGLAKVATDEDLAAAKVEANRSIEDLVRTKLATQMPVTFKVISGAEKFEITKQTITPEADENGKFSIFSDATLTVIAFEESDLLELLHQRARSEKKEEYDVKTETLNYGAARADLQSGRLAFIADYQAQLVRALDKEKLTTQVQGQSEAGLKAIVAALPGVERAQVSLWPFWVRRVPKNGDKIDVLID